MSNKEKIIFGAFVLIPTLICSAIVLLVPGSSVYVIGFAVLILMFAYLGLRRFYKDSFKAAVRSSSKNFKNTSLEDSKQYIKNPIKRLIIKIRKSSLSIQKEQISSNKKIKIFKDRKLNTYTIVDVNSEFFKKIMNKQLIGKS